MNAFTLAATALIVLLAPLAAVAALRRPIDGLVALQLAGSIGVLTLLCLSVGLRSAVSTGVAVVAAVTCWIGGLVVARFLGRWL